MANTVSFNMTTGPGGVTSWNVNMDGSSSSFSVDFGALCKELPLQHTAPVGVDQVTFNGAIPPSYSLSGTTLTVSLASAPAAGAYGFFVRLLFSTT